MTYHHSKIKRALIIIVAFIVLTGTPVNTAYAGYTGWGPVTHIGKYYFKYNFGNERLYISKNKNNGYKKTPVDSWAFVSNGKAVMYVGYSKNRYYLKSYDIAKKKVKKIRKLSKGYWEACGAAGQYIWLRGDKGIYRYDVGHNRLKLIKKNSGLYHLNGQYYLCSYGKEKTIKYKTEGVSGILYGTKEAIYKITKSGKLKRVQSLGYVYNENDEINYVINYGKIKRFYYSTNGAHDLYRIKSNGKGKKKIASFTGRIVSVYEKHCYIIEDEKAYKYVYKSGKKYQVDEWF